MSEAPVVQVAKEADRRGEVVQACRAPKTRIGHVTRSSSSSLDLLGLGGRAGGIQAVHRGETPVS
jgi:hypothetical protein